MQESKRGIKRAAVLLMALGPEISSQVLKLLPETIIQKVTFEIANTDFVQYSERDRIIDDFIEAAAKNETNLNGGIDYVRDLLNRALGSQRAKEVMDMLTQIQQNERPFAIARKADSQQLTNVLLKEHPQTTALILCYLQPEKAALVLSQFPFELQTEIAERIGTINRTFPTVIKKIEKILESKFSNLVENDMETVGGVKTLVGILNSVDRGTERNILGDLETKQPELAEIIKSSLFVFEDIVNLDRNSIQRTLRDIENEDLALALKGASEEVTNIIYNNMSQRAVEILKEDIQFMGPVRLSTVEEAQQKIVGVIRKLDEAGEIIIARGDQSDIIL